MTINGGGAATTVIDGNGTDRVFEVIGQVALILNGVTVTNGNTSTSTVKDGGGILGANSSLVVLRHSTNLSDGLGRPAGQQRHQLRSACHQQLAAGVCVY